MPSTSSTSPYRSRARSAHEICIFRIRQARFEGSACLCQRTLHTNESDHLHNIMKAFRLFILFCGYAHGLIFMHRLKKPSPQPAVESLHHAPGMWKDTKSPTKRIANIPTCFSLLPSVESWAIVLVIHKMYDGFHLKK